VHENIEHLSDDLFAYAARMDLLRRH